jgi:sterol 24-C-methyltransferase
MATATANADGRVHTRIANYTGFWEKEAAVDGEEHTVNRLDNYTDVVNGPFLFFSADRNTFSHLFYSSGYYDGATELYEFGWAQSFHFSRFYKGESFHQSVRILAILHS